ncbi:hypothetical protein VE03_00824 [Pseudogymnoascus sp. 23342-1-I1]|nr:hypothetical protein VE03_00824 [Pseudogymnoascus sp. 23342-1-I1]
MVRLVSVRLGRIYGPFYSWSGFTWRFYNPSLADDAEKKIKTIIAKKKLTEDTAVEETRKLTDKKKLIEDDAVEKLRRAATEEQVAALAEYYHRILRSEQAH